MADHDQKIPDNNNNIVASIKLFKSRDIRWATVDILASNWT